MAYIKSDKLQAVIIRENGEGDMIEVSCFLTQSHELSLVPTTNPVESGIDINDHVKQNPRKITLRGITTDDPLSLTATIDSFRTLIDPDTNEPLLPSNDTFQAFKKLYDEKETVSIVTNYDEYDNMILTSFSTQEDKDNGSSIDFTVTFTELRVVETATGTGINLAGKQQAALRAAEVRARAQSEKKASKKAKDEVTDDVWRSAAKKQNSYIGGLF